LVETFWETLDSLSALIHFLMGEKSPAVDIELVTLAGIIRAPRGVSI
jgi:hypothetical protein